VNKTRKAHRCLFFASGVEFDSLVEMFVLVELHRFFLGRGFFIGVCISAAQAVHVLRKTMKNPTNRPTKKPNIAQKILMPC